MALYKKPIFPTLANEDGMKRTRYSKEQIIGVLREAKVLLSYIKSPVLRRDAHGGDGLQRCR